MRVLTKPQVTQKPVKRMMSWMNLVIHNVTCENLSEFETDAMEDYPGMSKACCGRASQI